MLTRLCLASLLCATAAQSCPDSFNLVYLSDNGNAYLADSGISRADCDAFLARIAPFPESDNYTCEPAR